MKYTVKQGNKVLDSGLSLDDAKALALLEMEQGRKSPRIEIEIGSADDLQPTAPEQVAVASSNTFVTMALFCIRNHKAIDTSEVYVKTDPQTGEKVEFRNPYHWSGAMQAILRYGRPKGGQLDFLNSQYALVTSAVNALKAQGRTWPKVDTEDLDWSF